MKKMRLCKPRGCTHTGSLNKKEKGITLIVLVITIIILLILAGVTVAMLTGNNGILTQANDAKEKDSLAKQEERVKLLEQEISLEKYNNTTKTKLEISEKEAAELGWQWEKTGNSGNEYANITGYTGSESEIYIPSKIGSLNVPYISNAWYALQNSANASKIKKIVLPGKNYDYLSFSDWSNKIPNLETVIFNDGMTEIESCTYLLAELKNVHTLILPSTLKIIWNGSDAFGYSYISEIMIPKSVIKIPANMFSNSKGGPITIFCEAESKPKDWDDEWLNGAPEGTKVIWGYKRASFGNNNTTEEAEEKSENYVGYYADLNGDGKIEVDKDGIIYADLAVGTTSYGRWNNSASAKYEVPKQTKNFKEYTVSEENKSGPFGETKMISTTDTLNENRFYVMALSDFTTNGPLYDWYYSAFSKMTDYKTYTSTEFGTGKENTRKMIEKWNASGYGTQNACTDGYKDIWGQIQTKYTEGWFIPSTDEFSAFGGELGITKNNWEAKGLTNNDEGYWLSSQSDSEFGYLAANSWNGASIYSSGVKGHRSIRLSTIF